METLLLPDAFYLVLDDTPSDATTLCALADWYEDRGDLDNASCVRWTIRRGLHPIRFSREGEWRAAVMGSSWSDGWYWWAIDEPNWVEDTACRLPPALWHRLDHSFPYVPLIFKEYPTRRDAYEALFDAWPLFAPSNRLARKLEEAR